MARLYKTNSHHVEGKVYRGQIILVDEIEAGIARLLDFVVRNGRIDVGNVEKARALVADINALAQSERKRAGLKPYRRKHGSRKERRQRARKQRWRI